MNYTLVQGVSLTLGLLTTAGAAGQDLSYEDLRNTGIGERFTITDVDLGEGRRTDLRLARFEVLAPDAVILVDDRPLETDVLLLRGSAIDDPTSRVFIGVSRYGAHGFVAGNHPDLALSTGPFQPGADPRMQVTRVTDAARPNNSSPRACLTDDTYIVTQPVIAENVTAGEPPCRALRLAVDTDYEFTANLFAGNPDAAAAYAITLFAADSEIYVDQVNTRFVLSYLRLWTSNEDPYAGTDIGTTLNDFRSHWNAGQSHVERDLAHILSGGSGGGVAWVGVVCHGSYGYAASRVNGFFPMPVESNHPDNWDLVVTCHELGHNFGTGHTHGYDPPIDNCAGGECEGAADGTLMSYCHLCPGGIANMALAFHPIVRSTILNYLDNTCDLTTSPTPIAVDDTARIATGGAVDVDVLLNDLAGSCDATGISIASHDTTSAQGGTIELIPGDGPLGRPALSYAAPPTFTGLDTFEYEHPGGAAATVTIEILALRPPDGPGTTNGAGVDYYALPGGTSSLPDFDALSAVSSDIVDLVDFPSTDGPFATSGLSNNVGAVFSGAVSVPADGLYTLFTNSDDGSRLYIGDELVVDNDGLHGMVEIGGLVALAAGDHDVRVEFFEAGGGAGLIVSYEGPGVAKQPIPAGNWSHDGPCAGDIDGDAMVGLTDLVSLLANWGPCGAGACTADLNGDSNVDFDDLLDLLAFWGPC